jgi:hypothetical protein
MRQIETRIIPLLFLILVGVVSGRRSEGMKGQQVVPSTKKFLRSNLIPEYFKGVLLLNETQWGSNLGAECGKHVNKWLRKLRRNYDDLKGAPNWVLKSKC